MEDFIKMDFEVSDDVLENLENQGEPTTQYYLRIENESFGFVLEGIHNIRETDIKVIQEEYDNFFELQSNGKQFKLKEEATGTGLFDYIEEYEPEPAPPSPPTELELLQEEVLEQSEYMVEMDYRLMNLELGL